MSFYLKKFGKLLDKKILKANMMEESNRQDCFKFTMNCLYHSFPKIEN